MQHFKRLLCQWTVSSWTVGQLRTEIKSLDSRQLDTTLKLVCAVSAWKGSSTLSRGEYLSTNHSTFQTYVSEPCHLGQWASWALRSRPLDATLKCCQWKGSSTFTFYIAGSWYWIKFALQKDSATRETGYMPYRNIWTYFFRSMEM